VRCVVRKRMLQSQSCYEPSVEVVEQSEEDDSLLARPTLLPRRDLLEQPKPTPNTSATTVVVTSANMKTDAIVDENQVNHCAAAAAATPPTMFQSLLKPAAVINNNNNNDDDHDDEQGQEALWVEPDQGNDDGSLSSMGTPVRTTKTTPSTTPKSMKLFSSRKKTPARHSFSTVNDAAALDASPPPSSSKVFSLRKSKKAAAAPQIVLLGTFDPKPNAAVAANISHEQQQPTTALLGPRRSSFPLFASRTTALPPTATTTTPSHQPVSPPPLMTSDTISSLGFDKSFDKDCTADAVGVGVGGGTVLSPLSMSSLNAIMDGPVTPADNDRAHKTRASWFASGSGSGGGGAGGSGGIRKKATKSPKAWKKWKAKGGSLRRSPSRRDETRMQRYTATVIDKSLAHNNDSDEREQLPEETLDMSLVTMDAQMQAAIRYAMEHDDAQSLTSYDGVSLHTSPSDMKDAKGSKKKSAKSATTELLHPPHPPVQFAALQPTFVTATAADSKALIALAQSWESAHEENETDRTSPTVSNEDSGTMETSGTAESHSPTQKRRLKSGAAPAVVSAPVDLDITVDEDEDDEDDKVPRPIGTRSPETKRRPQRRRLVGHCRHSLVPYMIPFRTTIAAAFETSTRSCRILVPFAIRCGFPPRMIIPVAFRRT
jgi:hypothetical protein